MILCANPKAQYLSHRGKIDAALMEALAAGRYIHGENNRLFEKEFTAYCGVSGAVGVGSGTEALHVALAACGIGAGDEVITVSHTAVATVSAIELVGATPVFVDIEPVFLTMDPSLLERAITPRTRAILPVHVYGHPADMDAILSVARRRGLFVIEDCAQAHGARYKGKRVGSMGHMGCFSFYPTKNLGALGDGGMVVTNDPTLENKARLLREYGWENRYVSSIRGWNTRLDEIQAAVLRVKLPHLDEDNASRRRLASLYREGLGGADIVLPREMEQCEHVFHLLVIRVPQRDGLLDFLKRKDIHALVHYPVPIHLQPAYLGRLSQEGALPETERAAREILSLPLYPELEVGDVENVVRSVMEFCKEANALRARAPLKMR